MFHHLERPERFQVFLTIDKEIEELYLSWAILEVARAFLTEGEGLGFLPYCDISAGEL